MYIMHFFSVQRRRHDVQDCYEARRPSSQNQVDVVSIDLACRQVLGNLMRKEMTDFWIRMARAGKVAVFLA